eukprot:5410724-Amphidinium_carterae.1
MKLASAPPRPSCHSCVTRKSCLRVDCWGVCVAVALSSCVEACAARCQPPGSFSQFEGAHEEATLHVGAQRCTIDRIRRHGLEFTHSSVKFSTGMVVS